MPVTSPLGHGNENAGVFPGKMYSKHRKNHGCGQKKPKSTSSAIFGNNMRFRAENTRDSAQGYIQCRKCIGRPVVRTDGRTDVRTDGHVTTTSLPKFLS